MIETEITWLRPSSLVPATDIHDFGIAIKRATSGALHIGALFRSIAGQVKFLHLTWQDSLRCDDPDASYWWGNARIGPLNSQFMALLAEKVAQKLVGEQIDWGWSYQGQGDSPITSDGDWSKERQPMTCATFILALFVANGFRIVDIPTWPHRYEDRIWAEQMLQQLRRTASTHVVSLAQAIPNMTRIRPCEIAIAVTGAAGEQPPFTFDQVDAHAAALHQLL